MRTVLRLLFLFCLPIAARASAPDDVTRVFLEILIRDDVAFTASQVSQQGDPTLLSDLVELIDVNDCIAVSRSAWRAVSETADSVELTIDVDGTVTRKGRARPVVPLFRTWHVAARRSDGRWTLTRAKTEERRIAEAMAAAATAGEAQAIFLAAAGADPLEVVHVYGELHDASRNLERMEHGLALAEASGDRQLEVFAHRMAMKIAHVRQDRDRVMAELARLEQLAGDERPDVRAEAFFSIGLGRFFLNQPGEAIAAYGAAADLMHEVEEPVLTLKALHMKSWVASWTGRITTGMHAAERLGELAHQYGWEEGEVLGILNAGGFQKGLRNRLYARDLYLHALRLSRSLGRREFLPIVTFNIADLEMSLGNVERAEELVKSVIAEARPEHAPVMYDLLISAAARKGRFDDAEEYLRRGEKALAVPVGRRVSIDMITPWRAELLLRDGKPREALETIQRALPELHFWTGGADTALGHVRILHLLARALRGLGRNDEAIERLRQALVLFDEGRTEVLDSPRAQVELMNQVRGAYVSLVELLVERGDDAEALRVAERMRAAALRDVIARGRVDLSASMSEGERAREAELDQRVVDLNRELAKALTGGTPDGEVREKLAVARRELDAYRDRLRVAHPAVDRRRVQDDGSIEVPDGVTAVEYVVAETQTIAFVIARGGVRAFRLPLPREDVRREAARFATEVAGRSLTFRTPARKLHRMLLAPLEKELAGTTVCIIPDVELWTVPFHALIDSRGAYVADRLTLFYAHSLSLARSAVAPSAKRREALLAFGNPVIGEITRGVVASAFRDVTLGSLQDAEDEVRSLATMYRPERSRVYTRDGAREAIFKREAPEFRVIHIAAHAIVDDRAPMYSSIVLAAGRNERDQDGLLEAREVVDLPLQADLAVLSACDTARGRVGEGEGVIGLAWAFFAAGCPTTVVSQWKAESKPTATLMIELHKRLLAGDSPAAALRAAQRALRRKPEYRHPFHWAPFVAIGAAGRPSP
ncbi:MAG TPA: CHAT domain-containing tetratricopeptide repeat protein [Thermoanaerobaculia bacterium]